MIIEVKQEHIDNGTANQYWGCPIALAVREQTAFNNAAIGTSEWYPSGVLGSQWDLPEIATKFIGKFDKRKPVQPFSFELESA